MDGFSYILVFVIISLADTCCAEINHDGVYYHAYDGVRDIEQQQPAQQFVQLDNLIITSPDFLNPNNQISFAAPVGAQHPNQKPQPEPQPPHERLYHGHSIYIDSGIARSYVRYQRFFN